jgi:hypothetical protein
MRLFSLDFAASMPVAMRRTITTAESMHNHPARLTATHRRLLIGALLGLCVAAGAYYAYWRYVATQLTAGIETWAADQRAMGNQADFAWAGIGGFPFAFRAEFQQPVLRLRLAGAELAWQGSDLIAEMSPWNLRKIRLASAGEHNLWLQALQQSGQWRLATIGFKGEATFHGNGALAELSATLEQPDAALPGGQAVAAGQAGFALSLPETPPVDYTQPFAGLTLDLARVVLPRGTRLLTTDPIDQASLAATIMGPMIAALTQTLDPTLPQPPPPSITQLLSAWRDAGGDVEVQSFRFAQGPLTASGEATLALDSELQLLGAGTVTTLGLRDAVEILLADGIIPAERALVARATVKALERVGDSGKAEAKFALSLQNRTLSFGPAPLLVLPPIAWP